MNKKDPKLIALQFNECINEQNLSGLSDLMTEDHTCIIKEETHIGKETMTELWKQFFDMLPDYKNHFTRIESRENLVIIVGFSTCSHKPLEGPALWTARIENDRVAEWRIYDDTKENRKDLKINM